MVRSSFEMKIIHSLTYSFVVFISTYATNENPIERRDIYADNNYENGRLLRTRKSYESQCRDGYKLNKTTKVCDPFCNQKCINAFCIGPDKCRCYKGYYNVEDSREYYRCEPHCEDCLYGKCISPGKCSCIENYHKVHSRCEPICSKGCNGICISPGVCSCFEGFTLNTTTNVCEPNCRQDCINSTCVAPDECKCDEGHINVENSDRYVCEPYCDDCSNGVCTAPKRCDCNVGYEKVHSRCKPICDNGCINGYCTSWNHCKCHEGYQKDQATSHVCHPICSQGCINSTCIAPDTCQCDHGYGYEMENDELYKCKPLCNDCAYGDCIEPGVCECKNGYKRVHSRCEPICSADCVNGHCDKPNECKCYDSFEVDRLSKNICHPTCNQKCINSTCVAPNECKCDKGYTIEEENEYIYRCKPYCSNGCPNGECIEPEKCQCNQGYTEINSVCDPHCSFGCKHGRCIAPEQCECDEGYIKNGSRCSPSCKPDCINGLCEANNECKCKKGTWKTGAFYCTLKCSEFPFDKKCYQGSHFHDHSLIYEVNEAQSSIELSLNNSISTRVPFIQIPSTIIDRFMVIEFMCFTNHRIQDGTAEIVCSPVYEAAHCLSLEEGGPTGNTKPSSNVKKVDLVFLHRDASKLRTGHICENSNRVFYINGMSKLSMCLEMDGEKKETMLADIQTYALYAIIAIVVASSIVYIITKYLPKKDQYSKPTWPNPARAIRRPLIEQESELGEIGPQAYMFSDISDRLEDLN